MIETWYRKVLVVAFVGVAICWLGNVLQDAVLRQQIQLLPPFGYIDATDVLIMHLFGSTLPLLPIIFAKQAKLSLWLFATALSFATYVYGAWQSYQDSLTNFSGGANIGAGLIMLFWPFIAMAIVIFLMSKTGSTKTKQSG